jgi:xylan 1,4-beta-xylosidase
MIEQQLLYADMRDEYPSLRNLPIHVEEWGESSGGATGMASKPTAEVRNSQYGAAFLAEWVGRHIKMKLENDRRFESFTFCASGYERIPEYNFMGFRTLDTKDGFRKPILNAYELLGKLDDELVAVSGSADVPSASHITAFATRSPSKISIVVVNYQYKHPFNDGEAEKVTVRLKPHLKEKLLVKHWRIDDKHSNAYTVFKELGSPKFLNPFEKDAIRKRMYPEVIEPPYLLDDKGEISFFLPGNAVSLIEIIKN